MKKWWQGTDIKKKKKKKVDGSFLNTYLVLNLSFNPTSIVDLIRQSEPYYYLIVFSIFFF